MIAVMQRRGTDRQRKRVGLGYESPLRHEPGVDGFPTDVDSFVGWYMRLTPSWS